MSEQWWVDGEDDWDEEVEPGASEEKPQRSAEEIVASLDRLKEAEAKVERDRKTKDFRAAAEARKQRLEFLAEELTGDDLKQNPEAWAIAEEEKRSLTQQVIADEFEAPYLHLNDEELPQAATAKRVEFEELREQLKNIDKVLLPTKHRILEERVEAAQREAIHMEELNRRREVARGFAGIRQAHSEKMAMRAAAEAALRAAGKDLVDAERWRNEAPPDQQSAARVAVAMAEAKLEEARREYGRVRSMSRSSAGV